jgi:hypothetical protein
MAAPLDLIAVHTPNKYTVCGQDISGSLLTSRAKYRPQTSMPVSATATPKRERITRTKRKAEELKMDMDDNETSTVNSDSSSDELPKPSRK